MFTSHEEDDDKIRKNNVCGITINFVLDVKLILSDEKKSQ